MNYQGNNEENPNDQLEFIDYLFGGLFLVSIGTLVLQAFFCIKTAKWEPITTRKSLTYLGEGNA